MERMDRPLLRPPAGLTPDQANEGAIPGPHRWHTENSTRDGESSGKLPGRKVYSQCLRPLRLQPNPTLIPLIRAGNSLIKGLRGDRSPRLDVSVTTGLIQRGFRS